MNKDKLAILKVSTKELKDWLKFLLLSAGFVVLCYFGPWISLQWSQKYLPLLLHLTVIGFWACLTLLFIRLIIGEFGKKTFADSYARGILWPPFVYSVALLAIALCVFASISLVLQSRGWTRFDPLLPDQLFPVIHFYAWHFVDSIPGLDIPETLRWAQPYKYSDQLSGALLLVFKIAVIVPAIGSFKVWHEVKKDIPPKDF